MNKQPYTGLFESIIPDYSDKIYYLDQIIIHSRIKTDILEKLLPIEELRKHCSYFSVQRAKGRYWDNGWRSRLSITAPSEEFLILLQEYESMFQPYVISKVEVAKDIIVPSQSLPELDGVVRSLHKSLSINYAKKGSAVDVCLQETRQLRFYDPAKGGITCYIKNNAWQLACYARISKLTGQNCLHIEWRYLNTDSVKKKTGITTIEDLINFDPDKHCLERERSVSLMIIDKDLLGKFLLNIDGRRKLDPLIGQPSSKRLRSTWGRVGLIAEHFLSGIKTVTDFKRVFSEMKKEIKQRPGKRSAFDNQILKVDPSRFLKPLDINKLGYKQGFYL